MRIQRFVHCLMLLVMGAFVSPGLGWAEIKLGRMIVHPGFKVSYEYDDNIFLQANQTFKDGTREGKHSDHIVILSPSLTLQKPRERGEVFGYNFRYQANDEHFFEQTSENDLEHELSGRLIFAGPGERARFTLSGRYFDTVDPSSSESASNFGPRSERIDSHINGLAEWDVTRRLLVEVSGRYRDNNYEDTAIKGESTETVSARAGVFWKLTQLTSVGVAYTFRDNHYPTPFTGLTKNDDSTTHGVSGEIRWAPTSLLSGEVSGGYEERTYSDGRDNGQIARFGINLFYNPFTRTSVILTASRQLSDSSFRDINSVVRTKAQLTIQQKITNKLNAQIGGGYRKEDYDGKRADKREFGVLKERDDDRFNAEALLSYQIHRLLEGGFEYRYINNNSNFNDKDYINNVYSVFLSTVF